MEAETVRIAPPTDGPAGEGKVRWIEDFKGLSLRSLDKLVIDEQTGSISQLACDRPDKRELGKVTECQEGYYGCW
jgi:hypothetical protein